MTILEKKFKPGDLITSADYNAIIEELKKLIEIAKPPPPKVVYEYITILKAILRTISVKPKFTISPLIKIVTEIPPYRIVTPLVSILTFAILPTLAKAEALIKTQVGMLETVSPSVSISTEIKLPTSASPQVLISTEIIPP